MNKLPSISIVIPSFNQGRFLREALESIFQQNYHHIEVIVMDGGSTDESVDIIRSYEQHLTFWQSQRDEGQSSAINEGMRHCTGDLVAWLNSDDYYWHDALWSVARAYSTYPGYGLYIGNGFRYKQSDGQYIPFCRHHIALNRKALIEGLDYILQPATFFLHEAWEKVDGLNPTLKYCMDWDIVIRIAKQYPAVLINEFLAVNREYEDTKTSTGKIGRVAEICQMIQEYTQDKMTPGTLYFLLETLLDETKANFSTQLRQHIYKSMLTVRNQFAEKFGNYDGFPSIGDPQDKYYMPIPTKSEPFPGYQAKKIDLPSISIVTPSYNQAQFLGQTLDSIIAQSYPKLELIVMDGGSTDGSVDILRQYQKHLNYWVSEKDRGPAHAINKGFAMAKGEVIAWLNSDDMLSSNALWEVGRAFAEDPELDMIFANALYIDENNKLYLADHGAYKTGLYYGELQPLERVFAYWSYVHSVPQPTVFFRRRLLERCGTLDESFHFIFDFELFWRFMQKAKIKKLERTQAFYRIHTSAKTSGWNNFLIELYRFSRPLWPRIWSTNFIQNLKDFLRGYINRRYGSARRDYRHWLVAALVGLSAVTRIGNPEAIKIPLKRKSGLSTSVQSQLVEDQLWSEEAHQSKYVIDRRNLLYKSIFCSFIWPRHPGHSGGEIRDFHLLRHLLSMSYVEFFAIHDFQGDEREDHLIPFLSKLHSPKVTTNRRPDLLYLNALENTYWNKITDWFRQKNFPVPGFGYHFDVTVHFPYIKAFSLKALQETLESKKPDFLFVSPQCNPIVLTLHLTGINTRLIMASYDVESVRMNRLASSHSWIKRIAMNMEARRATRFEKDNLALYDGIIAVSELDKESFIRNYNFEPQRVLVIENSVDPVYFQYSERKLSEIPHIVYIASFLYLPNRQAALRLIRDIMPLVRERYPNACVWIVGQGPDSKLLSLDDGKNTRVTGKVKDVRPYLAKASVACIPLISGSGTKYKVLEAMSAGVPVVCTPLASEGLDLQNGMHLLLGKTDVELSSAILQVLDNPDLGTKLATQARAYVEKRYSWDANLTRLDEWLDTLLTLPLRRNQKTNK